MNNTINLTIQVLYVLLSFPVGDVGESQYLKLSLNYPATSCIVTALKL